MVTRNPLLFVLPLRIFPNIFLPPTLNRTTWVGWFGNRGHNFYLFIRYNFSFFNILTLKFLGIIPILGEYSLYLGFFSSTDFLGFSEFYLVLTEVTHGAIHPPFLFLLRLSALFLCLFLFYFCTSGGPSTSYNDPRVFPHTLNSTKLGVPGGQTSTDSWRH